MTSSSDLPQGDMRLLTTHRALALLAGTVPARVAYVAADGTPRVFPTHYVWTGEELVLGTYAGAFKIAGLRARPAVAVTIDTDEDPPTILQLRGHARVDDVDGVVPEYIEAMRRYRGDAQAEAVLVEIDRPGLRMARIAITPTWAGLIDFRQRFPQALSRGAHEERPSA
jgi:hypothetical protein